MASEYRVIFFENLDLVAAAFDWKRTQGEPPPNGRATKLTIDRDTLSFKIEVKKKDGTSSELNIQDAQMTAALIMLCRKRKIPLPMTGTRTRALRAQVREGPRRGFVTAAGDFVTTAVERGATTGACDTGADAGAATNAGTAAGASASPTSRGESAWRVSISRRGWDGRRRGTGGKAGWRERPDASRAR